MGERIEALRDPDESLQRKLDAVASLSVTIGIWAAVIGLFFTGFTLSNLNQTLEEEGCMKAFESPLLKGMKYTEKNGQIVDKEIVDNPFKENNSSEKTNFSNSSLTGID